MHQSASDRARLSSRPLDLYLLSTTMAAIAATGVAFMLHAALDEERQQTVVCACACDESLPEVDAAEQGATPPVPDHEPSREPQEAELELSVEGALDRELVRRIIATHIDEIRYCYQQGLARDAGLEGRVVVTFTIDPGGEVSRASIADSTLPDDDVATCMTGAVNRWLFPRPRRGNSVEVTYPFVLSPG